MKHAAVTARNPVVGDIAWPASVDDDFLLTVWIWTTATPRARRKSENHFDLLRVLWRRRTEKKAVVRIFIW